MIPLRTEARDVDRLVQALYCLGHRVAVRFGG